jgi:hypothetical protein
MNPERILNVFNRHGVKYLIIGGMNIFLRHQPQSTFDIDLWIEDSMENLARCHKALVELEAQWGREEKDWEPVSKKTETWLNQQQVFCIYSPAGAIDIFRSVTGLVSWEECNNRAIVGKTKNGILFSALGDKDMLKCQLALPENQQKKDRIRILKESIKQNAQ